ncbi:hypothetical protein EIP91_009534 [Steccherinum ochraceum]|uniref:Uncharacterized protein n=1 Tax=Steccherinum ochraceum TaxID=92696 RepID=A0A4R0R6Y0_9APHY|nr:hypothetical protein EIP91_009534 [Steccherinum ochraceum]
MLFATIFVPLLALACTGALAAPRRIDTRNVQRVYARDELVSLALRDVIDVLNRRGFEFEHELEKRVGGRVSPGPAGAADAAASLQHMSGGGPGAVADAALTLKHIDGGGHGVPGNEYRGQSASVPHTEAAETLAGLPTNDRIFRPGDRRKLEATRPENQAALDSLNLGQGRMDKQTDKTNTIPYRR